MYGVIIKLAILNNTQDYFSKAKLKTREPMVTPMPLTSFYWLIVSQDDNNFYVSYKSLFSEFKVNEIQAVPKNHELLENLRWKGKDRIEQLKYITNGYYAMEQSNDTIYCYDLRFGTMKQLLGSKLEKPLTDYGLVVEKGIVQKSFPIIRTGASKAVKFENYIDKVFGK